MVFKDGQAFKNEKGDARVQNVMDNLIHRREIPVIIGVLVNPGRTPEQPEPTPKDWEIDRPIARPNTTRRTTSTPGDLRRTDARPVTRITTSPKTPSSTASAGPVRAPSRPSPSPGIAPTFRKVFSIVGSFVNLRGGHVYPERVLAAKEADSRLFPGRPQRQPRRRKGGDYDPKRDWFLQNVRLVDVLTKKGYDVNYAWGIGLHGQKQGVAIFPDTMCWLWRDHAVSVDVKDAVERSFQLAGGQSR